MTDGRTDRQTLRDSKNRAYASHRAVKTRMVWLPDGEKISEDMFIRLDMIHERDEHTNTHTATA